MEVTRLELWDATENRRIAVFDHVPKTGEFPEMPVGHWYTLSGIVYGEEMPDAGFSW